MNILDLCCLGLLLLSGGRSATNKCEDPSTDSSGGHCVEVEDSTAVFKDEGAMFFDQLNDHPVIAEIRETHSREIFDENVSKWYPELHDYEESPLEVRRVTTTNPAIRKGLAGARDLDDEDSFSTEVGSLSTKGAQANELLPDELNFLTVGEKKYLPTSVTKSRNSDSKESNFPAMSSSGSADGELSSRKPPPDPVVLAAPAEHSSSQATSKGEREIPDGSKSPNETGRNVEPIVPRDTHLNKSEQLNTMDLMYETFVNIPKDRENTLSENNSDSFQLNSNKNEGMQRAIPEENGDGRKSPSALYTEVENLSKNESESDSVHADIPQVPTFEFIKKRNLEGTSSEEVTESIDANQSNASPGISSVNISETSPTVSTLKFERLTIAMGQLEDSSRDERLFNTETNTEESYTGTGSRDLVKFRIANNRDSAVSIGSFNTSETASDASVTEFKTESVFLDDFEYVSQSEGIPKPDTKTEEKSTGTSWKEGARFNGDVGEGGDSSPRLNAVYSLGTSPSPSASKSEGHSEDPLRDVSPQGGRQGHSADQLQDVSPQGGRQGHSADQLQDVSPQGGRQGHSADQLQDVSPQGGRQGHSADQLRDVSPQGGRQGHSADQLQDVSPQGGRQGHSADQLRDVSPQGGRQGHSADQLRDVSPQGGRQGHSADQLQDVSPQGGLQGHSADQLQDVSPQGGRQAEDICVGDVSGGGIESSPRAQSENSSSEGGVATPVADDWSPGGEERLAAADRLVAEEEGGESSWSRRTREEHAEVVSRFLPSGQPVGSPVPDMLPSAQHQRRPSRLSDSPPELMFPGPPPSDTFHIQELGLSDGVFVFSYLASFLSLLQPSEFPIELIRDALWNRVSLVSLITQSLRVEAGFIACLALGVLVALSLPCYVTVHACRGRGRRSGAGGDWDDGAPAASDCRRRALLFVLHVLVLLTGLGLAAMFATNEQMAGAVSRTPRVLHTALGDATAFLRSSNRQLRAVITESLDRALTAASEDLDNVEMLLGEPIQNELAVETGVDVALDTLVDVGSVAAAISGKVGFALAYGAETRDLVSEARDRLHDLRQQVESFRRQCPTRDRPLCETVDPNGLDAAMRLGQLLDDRRLAEIHDLREANLSSLAQNVRAEFQRIPQLVEAQTRDARIAARRQLARQRSQVEDDAWALDAVSRDLSARVEGARDKALLLVRGLADIEYWRWLAGLGASVSVLVTWLLMAAGLLCGCCGAQQKAAPTLLASVVLASVLSLALWLVALGALLAGGHGEVFVCRPLYDEPRFPALTGLLDEPGVVFRRDDGPGGRGGAGTTFLSGLLYGNGTLDVPLKDVLMGCRENRAAYAAFDLRSVYDVGAASDHRTWDALHQELSRLQANLTGLRLLAPDLQRQLTSLVASAAVNLTAHRLQLSRPVTGKDLSSFADQLESVANQIKDLATASRMETLAARTRRLLASHIQPLEQRKEDLVYQLTALEVQMLPLQRQVNQSLSHLKTIQYFIDNQGESISKQKAKDYVRRLLSYVDQYRDHALRSTSDHVAPCKPVWDLYHAVRQLLCRHILDPLNGFWFSCVWCLLMFLAATPLCLKLVEICKDGGDRRGLLQPGNSDSPSEALMMPESNTWSSNNRSGESDGW